MEKTLSGAKFYAVGGTWDESTSEVENTTAVLRILGGDADVDNFIKSTMGTQEPVEAEVIALKAKAIANKWALNAIMGQTTSNSTHNSTKNFKGLLRVIAEFESATTADLDGAVLGDTGNNTR